MRIHSTIFLLVCAAVLVACSGVEMMPVPSQTVAPSETAPGPAAAPTISMTEEASTAMPPAETRPVPEGPTPQNRPTQKYAPLPGDNSMRPGRAFVDSASLDMQGNPPQAVVMLSGNLPTPCNKLRVKMDGPDQNNHIDLTIYSVAPVEGMCSQVLEPFEAIYPLGPLPAGKYSLSVNGKTTGQFMLP